MTDSAVLREPGRLRAYFLDDRGPLAVVTVSGILCNAGMLAGPWFEGLLAQRLLEVLGGEKTWRDMAALAALYLGSILFVQGMRYLKRFYVRRFANDTGRRMRRVLYRTLVRTDRRTLRDEGAGALMTKAIADVDACAEGMRKVTTEIFDTGVQLAAYFVLLLTYDWRLALCACAFPPASYLLAEALRKPVCRSAAAAKRSAGRLGETTLDRVSNALTYRTAGCEAARDRVCEAALSDYEKKSAAATLWETVLPPLYLVLSMGGVAAVVLRGAKNVGGTGWAVWNIAAFTTFLSTFLKLATKSSHAANLFNAAQKARVSWGRLKPLLKTTPAAAPAEIPAPGVLTARGLRVGEPPILTDVSFSIAPGQIFGVTGPVASGKTALGLALLGELPCGGELLLDGKPLRPEAVAYVGHDPELLSDTVAENLRLGEDVDADWAMRAVRLDLDDLPEGAETFAGSGGGRLSGGQQARVALARALCRKRPVLVLDDPFSAVDRATEAEIFRTLRAQGGATLLLSHRLSQFPQLDGVIWLEDGRAEVSTHEALLRSNPRYAAFFRAQEGDGHEAG